MLHRIAALAFLAACLFPGLLLAGGKADENAAISFHIETEATDNPKMIFPQLTNGETRYFRRMSEVSTKDIAAFGPFPSDDGSTYGVVIQLKPAPSRRYGAITSSNQGKWLAARVNGRVVDAVIIDKQIDDGILVIWKGITLEEINQYDKVGPRIGEDKKGKKKK